MRKELRDALIHADLDQAAKLLEQGADINKKNKWDDTLLHDVILLVSDGDKRHRIVKFMLDRGADPTILDDEGGGPLWLAVFAQDTELLRLLLDRGADPNLERNGDVHESLYDAAEFDYRYHVYDGPLPEKPTEADKESEEAWLNFLDRIARKYGHRRPDYVMLLRERGAKTWTEQQGEENDA